jgi:adenine-specific DNA-methyltransferase
MFFTERNARRIDATRQQIQQVPDPEIQSYLYYCGIEALSRVSNTAGTHGAYMKQWKDRARTDFALAIQPTNWCPGVQAYTGDVAALAGTLNEDILYLDPPYTKRQYGPNYHLYDTFVLDRLPTVKGVTGLPEDISRSAFCKAEDDVGTLVEAILKATTAKLVLVSYSSDGTLSLDNMLTRLMQGFGHNAVELQVMEYTRYRSAEQGTDKLLSGNYLREYLFIIEKADMDLAAWWNLLTGP